jgi:hypothetical protein
MARPCRQVRSTQTLAGTLIVRAVVAAEFLLAALDIRARAAAAAMPPPPMARETVAALIVVAVRAALKVLRRLRSGDERRQPVVALELVRLLLRLLMRRLLVLRLLRLLLIGLWLLVVLRLLLIGLMLRPALLRLLGAIGLRRLLLAEIRLPLHRWLALHGLLCLLPGLTLRVLVPIVERAVPAAVVGTRRSLLLRLVIGILLPELLLSRCDQTEIMLGMLVMILGGDVVTRRHGVARKLQVLLGDGVGRSANLHILTVRLVHPRQRIVVMMVVVTMTTLVIAVASSHALVLTVSHGSPVANSLCRR